MYMWTPRENGVPGRAHKDTLYIHCNPLCQVGRRSIEKETGDEIDEDQRDEKTEEVSVMRRQKSATKKPNVRKKTREEDGEDDRKEEDRQVSLFPVSSHGDRHLALLLPSNSTACIHPSSKVWRKKRGRGIKKDVPDKE